MQTSGIFTASGEQGQNGVTQSWWVVERADFDDELSSLTCFGD